MIRLKLTKIMAAVLAASLLAEPLVTPENFTRHVQAEETFANVHELYNYWCSNDYENFPENVGDVYCYYYSPIVSTPPYDPGQQEYIPTQEEHVPADPGLGAATGFQGTERNTASIAVAPVPVSAPAIVIDDTEDILVDEPDIPDILWDVSVGKPIEPIYNGEIEVAADQNYVLVIGLLNDTPEAEQEILSKLQDKNHVAFASCQYSHKELMRVYQEISLLMSTENLGICGVGTTCNVDAPDANNQFKTMRNYVDVMILQEFYETTAAMLKEKYGDKIEVGSGMVATDCTVEEYDDALRPEIAAADTDVMIFNGANSGVEKPTAATVGIGGVSNSKNAFGFLRTTTALTLGDTFTLKGNWKKTAKIVWTVIGENKVKVLSKKANGNTFKIQAKKAGYVTITAKNKKNKKTVSQKILILDKNGTVSNQNKLTAALQAANVKKITIKTEEKKKFTIPTGDYQNKKIIVNAPKSDITVEDSGLLETMALKKSKAARIMGTTPEKAKQIFGEPVASLSGFYGDIFQLANGTKVTVYYNIDQPSGTVDAEDYAIMPATGDSYDRPAEDKGETDDMGEILSFYGTILEVYQGGVSALVEPEEGSSIRSSGDRVSVALAVNPIDTFSVGDRIEVYYGGGVMESYPLQINTLDVKKA